MEGRRGERRERGVSALGCAMGGRERRDVCIKEWFLVGHMFSKRLETCLVSNSDEFINEAEKARSNSAIDSSVVQANSSSSKSNGQISPTFLVKKSF